MTGLPRRERGRQTAEATARYQAELAEFCSAIKQIRSTLDFAVSSRGWCYILEERIGLLKGDFDRAQDLINVCRKNGGLPLDICAEDSRRACDNLEQLDDPDPAAQARLILEYVNAAHTSYVPFSFWDEQDVYVQMMVEKIDLKNLFAPVCDHFKVPLINGGGWCDINGRAAMMKRFAEREREGKRCVLLICGDHDPGGLSITDFVDSNLADLSRAVGWSPDKIIVHRFGLNADFIETLNLTWIDNLETASGKRLDDPTHKDHFKPYVQGYIRRFGVRKVEANALVVRPAAGRELCRQAILQYASEDALARYNNAVAVYRREMSDEVRALLSR